MKLCALFNGQRLIRSKFAALGGCLHAEIIEDVYVALIRASDGGFDDYGVFRDLAAVVLELAKHLQSSALSFHNERRIMTSFLSFVDVEPVCWHVAYAFGHYLDAVAVG